MQARARDLVGRTIVAVDFRRFRTTPLGQPRSMALWATDPILTLDNGRRVWFVTEETEVAEYGTAICISDKKENLKS